MKYVVFSDESSHTDGDFRSIAAVSLPCSRHNDVVKMSDQLKTILESSTKGELKWRNVGRNGTKNVARAKASIDFVFSSLSQELRIDVVIWDVQDSRHSVENRDDIANYSRMYFHLHRSLMRRREPNASWHLRPDALSIIDWKTIRDCLNSNGSWQRYSQESPALFENFDWISNPRIKTLREVDSKKTPFVNLADLFAGMAAYTRNKSSVIRTLLNEEEELKDLFPNHVPACDPNKLDRGRFKVIRHLVNRCKQGQLGVSIKDCGYLRTQDPRKPINFWHYNPQHIHDQAPRKKVRPPM